MENDSDIWTVDSPSELVDITTNETPSPPKQLRIRLLQPLQSEEMLAACREHATKRIYVPSPATSESRVEEVLDLEPLFKAWRSAWSTIPVRDKQLPKYVLDIDLPSTVQWGHAEEFGMRVIEQRLSRFLQGFATVMSVRSKFRARYELVGSQVGWFRTVMGILEKLNEGKE